MSNTHITSPHDPYEEADGRINAEQIDEALALAARVLWRSGGENVAYTMPDGQTYALALSTAIEASVVIPGEGVH